MRKTAVDGPNSTMKRFTRAITKGVRAESNDLAACLTLGKA
jgi:hypothetical protein